MLLFDSHLFLYHRDSELLKEAKILFQKLRVGGFVEPKVFKEEFARRHPSFIGNFQQDAGEFLDLFLDETNCSVRELLKVNIF